MINKQILKQTVIENYQDNCANNSWSEEDGREISEDELFRRAKQKVIEDLENDDRAELIEYSQEDEAEKFEEARRKAIEFINNLE